MPKYHSQSRFQLVKIVAEGGKDRRVNGPAYQKEGPAIAEAKSRYAKFGGIWLVADMKPTRRTDGFSEVGKVVFDTMSVPIDADHFSVLVWGI